MIKKYSALTYKILTFDEIQQDSNFAIDWAVELMLLGFESTSLHILAGLNKPTTYNESIAYVKSIITDLNLELKHGDEATLSYSIYLIKKIADGRKIRNYLDELYQICQLRSYEKVVYDFFLLYWAWDDLDYEDTLHNHYWNGARRDNIINIVKETAEKWLCDNKGLCFLDI